MITIQANMNSGCDGIYFTLTHPSSRDQLGLSRVPSGILLSSNKYDDKYTNEELWKDLLAAKDTKLLSLVDLLLGDKIQSPLEVEFQVFRTKDWPQNNETIRVIWAWE